MALGLLLLFNALFNPAFFDLEASDGRLSGALVNLAERSAPLILVALGMTIVIATAGVDLSVGAVFLKKKSLCAFLAHDVAGGKVEGLGWPAALAIAAALLVSLAAGMWNGALVSFFRVQPIVATLMLMVAGRGIAQLVSDGQKIPATHDAFSFIGGGYFLGFPFAVSVAVVMLVLTALLTRRTALGMFLESVGNNESASRCAGVRARFVLFLAYAWSGACAGVAGLLFMADNTEADASNAGLYWELDAILAVVIGGTSLRGGRFTLLGSVIGALIIQTLTTTILMIRLFGRDIPPDYTLVVKAVVVLIVCLLQSESFREKLRFGARRKRRAPA
jgi:simple sugar transport system permease protein